MEGSWRIGWQVRARYLLGCGEFATGSLGNLDVWLASKD